MTWARAALGDLGTWFGGTTPSKSRPEFWTDGTIPWISPKDMRSEVLASTQDCITDAAVEGSSVRIVPAGSVAIVVRSGIIERTIPVAVVPFDATLNQDMKAVVPRPDVDSRWIAWAIRAHEREILRDTRKAGTTVASIEWPRFKAFELPIPPLDEQHRIVDLIEDHLSRLDAAEAYLVQGFRKLGALKTKVLASLHVGEMVPLGAMSVDSGYGTSVKCVANGAGPAVVRIPNLVDGQVDLSDEKRVVDADADVSTYMLDPGDVLIIRTNGSINLIGRSAVVQPGTDAAFASYLIRYRVRQDLVRPRWVYAMLSTPQIRGRIESLAASSAGQHNLSLGKLDPLELPVPSLAVQDAGLHYLAGIDAERSRLSAAITDARRRATVLRSSLLAAAFSGRLTATAPDVSDTQEMIEA